MLNINFAYIHKYIFINLETHLLHRLIQLGLLFFILYYTAAITYLLTLEHLKESHPGFFLELKTLG